MDSTMDISSLLPPITSKVSWLQTGPENNAADILSFQSDLPSIGTFPGASSISQMFENSVPSAKFINTRKNFMKQTPSATATTMTPSGTVLADEGPSPFRCSLCCTVLTSRTALKTHVMQQHEGKVVVKCPHCDKAFTRQSQLGKHIDSCHDERTGEYYCDKCPFKNRDLEVFNQHIHTHNVCQYCRNEFTQLTRHEPKCPYRP